MNHIRDVIAKYNLHIDDLLRRMDLKKDGPSLNANRIANALIQLDPSLDEYRSNKLAIEILGDKQKIEVRQLIQIIGVPPGIQPKTS